MSNRKQRRDTKKVMNRPELKLYVDKVCMDMANVMMEHCERASKDAKEKGTELKFEDVEDKVKESMSGMGEQLAKKVQEIARSYSNPLDKPKILQNRNSGLKLNIR